MRRTQFPLSSDQLELLLAFESKSSLSALAELMGRDPSVVSRNLQRLAEELPVLAKKRSRWQITALGRQINTITTEYLRTFEKTVPRTTSSKERAELCFSGHALLMIINAQNALRDPLLGNRSNGEAEANIQKLLSLWRKNRMPIAHVRHVSEKPGSSFLRDSKSADFIFSLSPKAGELVVEKMKSSAFSGTSLSETPRTMCNQSFCCCVVGTRFSERTNPMASTSRRVSVT